MREILFKAKRKDNGEWVEGFYEKKIEWHRLSEGRYAKAETHYICVNMVSSEDSYIDRIIVVPETICQYTGLTDKNGNKIWENDIVLDSEEREVYKMVWSQDSMRYCVEKASGFDYEFDSSYASSIEVIGNIFDNPELIGA